MAVAVVVDVSGPTALQPDGTMLLDEDTLARARARRPAGRGPHGAAHGRPPARDAGGASRLGRRGCPHRGRASGRHRRPHALARPFVDVDLAALQRSGLITEANAQAEAGADVVRSRLAAEPLGGIWMSGPTLGPRRPTWRCS